MLDCITELVCVHYLIGFLSCRAIDVDFGAFVSLGISLSGKSKRIQLFDKFPIFQSAVAIKFEQYLWFIQETLNSHWIRWNPNRHWRVTSCGYGQI